MALKDMALGAGLGVGGGLLASKSGLFGKKKTPKLDTTALNQNVNESFNQQQANLTRLRPENELNLGRFNTGVDTAQTGLSKAVSDAIGGYRSQIDPLNSSIVQNRSDSLRRSVADARQNAVAKAQELGAAGAGFGSGATRAALAGIPLNFGAQLTEGLSGIERDALQNALSAESDIFGANRDLAGTQFTTDIGQEETGLGSRTNALGSEISGLGSLINDKYTSLNNIEQARQGFDIQNAINSNASQDAMLGNLIQLGGTVGGALLGGPVGAAGGSSLASLIAQQQNRPNLTNPNYQRNNQQQAIRTFGGR